MNPRKLEAMLQRALNGISRRKRIRQRRAFERKLMNYSGDPKRIIEKCRIPQYINLTDTLWRLRNRDMIRRMIQHGKKGTK
jgi:hypothetical protein